MKSLPVCLRWLQVLPCLLVGLSLSAQTTPPFATGFESTEGYSLGSLAAQNGWTVPQGSAVITNDTAYAGTFSVGLLTSSGPTKISHDFAAFSGGTVTYVDFWARPSVAYVRTDSTTVSADGSIFSLVRLDSSGHLVVFDGDGSGGGRWVSTGRSVALNRSGQASTWVRFTVRQDYSTKKWDLWIDDQLALVDLGLKDNTQTYLSQFSVLSSGLATGYLDNLAITSTNPLFTDADNDGMADSWETAHGLSATTNDRNGDLDGDGLSNIEEYALGTNPNSTDTDGDGLPDAWEVAHATNPLVNDAATDPGGVGRTLLQSYQGNLSPWPTPVIASGLQAWYRADSGVVKDGSNKVSEWDDVSGHRLNSLQTTGSLQPLLVASAMFGQPAVSFDGTTLLRTSGVADVQGWASDLTVIIVTVPGATQAAYGSLVDMSSDTAHGFVVGQLGGATNQEQLWFMDGAQTGWYAGPASAIAAGQVQVLSVMKNGTTGTAFVNGIGQGSGSVPAAMLTPLTALALGGRASGSYSYNGQIAEVLIYNRALTNTERGEIESSLQTKYVNPDSDGDGLPDAWERQYFGTLAYGAADDPGNVGRTLLQSYQGNLSPWPAPIIGSGLRAWYRADLGVTKDGTNLVNRWMDLSGQGSHVVQSGGLQPTWLPTAAYTHPALQFDGTTFLKTAGGVDEQSGSADVTVIMVAAPAASQPAYASLVDLSSDSAHGFVVGQLGNSANQFQLWFMDGAQTGWYSSPPAGASASLMQVISVVKSGAAASSYLNGVSQGTGSVPATMLAPTAALAIGNRASGLYGYNGQIAEVLVYNRALSDTERASIETALQTKYINPDSDVDGLPDSWEQQYLGSLSYGATDDPGNVGRTLLQSYQGNLSPWPVPTVASGLRSWFSANLGVVKDGSNRVSQWADLSGQGFHVAQSGALEPMWVPSVANSQPMMQFDGSTYLKTKLAVDETAGSNDLTVITVALPGSSQPAYASLVDLSSDTAHGFVLGQLGSGTNQFQLWFMDSGQSGWYSGPTANTSASQVQIVSVVKNGTTAAAYLNGASQGSGTVPATMLSPTAALAVGNRASGLYGFNGQVAEVLVYNRALSDTERASIETTLSAKYGIGEDSGEDTDNNGLPDAWERRYFGHIGVDPNTDPDGDGLNNITEYKLGRNPTKGAVADTTGAVNLRVYSPTH